MRLLSSEDYGIAQRSSDDHPRLDRSRSRYVELALAVCRISGDELTGGATSIQQNSDFYAGYDLAIDGRVCSFDY